MKSVWILWRWKEFYGLFETEQKAKDWLEDHYRNRTPYFDDFEIVEEEVQ